MPLTNMPELFPLYVVSKGGANFAEGGRRTNSEVRKMGGYFDVNLNRSPFRREVIYFLSHLELPWPVSFGDFQT